MKTSELWNGLVTYALVSAFFAAIVVAFNNSQAPHLGEDWQRKQQQSAHLKSILFGAFIGAIVFLMKWAIGSK